MGDKLLSGGNLAGASQYYEQLVNDPDTDPEILTDAATMYALLLLKRGDFTGLAATVEQRAGVIDADRLLGDLHRYHANWDLARERYESGLRRAMAGRDAGLVRLFEAELALVDGWTGLRAARPESVEPTGTEWADFALTIADALTLADDDPARATQLLDAADSVATAFGLVEADVTVARAFLAALHGDGAGLDEAAKKLATHAARTGTYASWFHVVNSWRGQDQEAPTVAWLEGPGVPEGWSEVLGRRSSL